ncbi:hypothetical protein [Paraburkholderia tropica]|uniref:hypothetical protein n=1 Tax=Paraburkholderia tropica TaxID=92647 RepID=UPI0038BAB3CE
MLLAQRFGETHFLTCAAILSKVTPYPMFLLVQAKSLFAMVAGIAFAIFSLLGIVELCRYKHTTRNHHAHLTKAPGATRSLPRLARRAPIA